MLALEALIALNVAVWLAMVASSRGRELTAFKSPTLLSFGALYQPFVRKGETWRLLTSQFIHVSPIHLGMNMYALWQAGDLLVRLHGALATVLVYVVTGIGGGAAMLAWRWGRPVTVTRRGGALASWRHPLTVAAGASGAICGLIGAVAVEGQLRGGEAGMQLRDAMVRWGAIVLLYGLAPGIDNAAHVGGMVVGAVVLGGAILLGLPVGQPGGLGSLDEGAAAVALLALVAAVGFGGAWRARGRRRPVEQLVAGGLAHAERKEDEAAASDFAAALALYPPNAPVAYELGRIELRRGRFDEARAAVTKALAIDDFPQARALLAALDAPAAPEAPASPPVEPGSPAR